jgi:hypothetical protein
MSAGRGHHAASRARLEELSAALVAARAECERLEREAALRRAALANGGDAVGDGARRERDGRSAFREGLLSFFGWFPRAGIALAVVVTAAVVWVWATDDPARPRVAEAVVARSTSPALPLATWCRLRLEWRSDATAPPCRVTVGCDGARAPVYAGEALCREVVRTVGDGQDGTDRRFVRIEGPAVRYDEQTGDVHLILPDGEVRLRARGLRGE